MVVGALGQTLEPAAKRVEEAPQLEPGKTTSFCIVNLHRLLIRSCTSPAPSCGGTACPGSSSQDINCNTQCCVVNGGWSSWSNYGACSRTCGRGTKTRTRSCTSPSPSCGGSGCPGRSYQNTNCNMPCCRRDGYWSPWSLLGACSTSCDEGTRIRTRTCNYLDHTCKGAPCPGDPTRRTKCNTALHQRCYRLDQDYFGRCVQNYQLFSGCKTNYNSCRNGAHMVDFGGTAKCCCRCCKNVDGARWCGRNTEGDGCGGSAGNMRMLINVTKNEERLEIGEMDEEE